MKCQAGKNLGLAPAPNPSFYRWASLLANVIDSASSSNELSLCFPILHHFFVPLWMLPGHYLNWLLCDSNILACVYLWRKGLLYTSNFLSTVAVTVWPFLMLLIKEIQWCFCLSLGNVLFLTDINQYKTMCSLSLSIETMTEMFWITHNAHSSIPDIRNWNFGSL